MKLSNTLKNIALLVLTIFISSCTNNDDDGVPTTCTTQGLFYTIGTNPQVFEPEANLTTEFFTTSSNGPEVEIYGAVGVFVTTTVIAGQTGTCVLTLGNGPTETLNVTCAVTGSAVGDTMRFFFNGTYNGNAITGEYCVTIDAIF